MADVAACIFIFAASFFTVVALFNDPPSPATVAAPCAERGRVQSVTWQTFTSAAMVVCRDGSVHKIARP